MFSVYLPCNILATVMIVDDAVGQLLVDCLHKLAHALDNNVVGRAVPDGGGGADSVSTVASVDDW